MAEPRTRIDSAFESLARLLYRHRLKTLLLLVLISGALWSRLPAITTESSIDGFFRKDDPALLELITRTPRDRQIAERWGAAWGRRRR